MIEIEGGTQMMERKTSGFELKRLDEKGQFVARIARLNQIDLDNDVTLPGAFGNDQVAPILVGHNWQQIPLGKAAIREEGDEVLAYGTLNLALDAGRSFYEALKFDVAHPPTESEFSYGFVVKASEPGLFEGQRVRFLKSLRVLEVSGVIAGAGDTTLVAVKSGAGDRQELLVYLQSLPREQQEAWLTEAQALCTEARVLLLDVAFDDLSAGKQAYRYVHADPWDGRVLLAKDTVAEACAELGCGLPKTVRLFTSCDPEKADFWDDPMCGFCTKTGEIGISWNLTPEEIVWVAAHEAAHLAGMNEFGADAFGERFKRRHSAGLLGVTPRPAVAVDPVIVSAAEAKELRKRYGLTIPYVYYS